MYNSDTPSAGTPQSINSTAAAAGTPPLDGKQATGTNDNAAAIGSPFKKQRPSLPGMDGAMIAALDDVSPATTTAPPAQTGGGTAQQPKQLTVEEDEDEEL